MSVGSFGQSEPQRLSLFINGRRFIGFGLSNRNSQEVIADGIAKGIIYYLNDMISENKT